MKLVLVLFHCVLFVSCAHIDVTKLPLDKHPTTSCVDIAVKDLRPYIQSGTKSPHFIGIIQGGHGKAFEYTSNPRSTLAKDLGLALKESLETMVYEANYIESEERLMKGASRCKALVLTYKELKLDSRVNGYFSYDAELELYSAKRKLLASTHKTGKKEVIGGHFFPASAARENVTIHTKSFIEELLNDPLVKARM